MIVTRSHMLGSIAAAMLAPACARATTATVPPSGAWTFAGATSAERGADASGNGHEATFNGNVAFTNGPVPASSGALVLDGNGAYAEVASAAAFSIPTSGRGLTVAVWMRPDALAFAGETSERYIHWLGKGEAGTFEWGFRFYSSDSPDRPNRISAYAWNPVATNGGSNLGAGAYFQDELEAGTWLRVVAMFDAADASNPNAGISIYRDGRFRAGPERSHAARYTSYAIAPVAGHAPVRFGTRDRQSYFTGALAGIAIYPRVLGADEIAAEHSRARQ